MNSNACNQSDWSDDVREGTRNRELRQRNQANLARYKLRAALHWLGVPTNELHRVEISLGKPRG